MVIKTSKELSIPLSEYATTDKISIFQKIKPSKQAINQATGRDIFAGILKAIIMIKLMKIGKNANKGNKTDSI